MSYEGAEKLANEIIQKRKEFLSSKIQRYPASNFRASDIHECDRYLAYTILNWQDRKLHDEGLQAIFERGNREEQIVISDLMQLGYKFIYQQTPIEIRNRNNEIICRGSIDGKIIFKDETIPVEIKSMNINNFNSIRSLEDFQKRPLLRKYLRQMQLYCFGNNEEAGIFILSDLQGHYKLITISLDFDECELILKRMETVWEFVKKKELPERIGYHEKLCSKCAYGHICLQEVKHEGSKFIENEELETKLERREELKESIEEYEMLDTEIKGTFKEVPDVYIGKNWQILGKWQEKTRVDTQALPDDIRQKYSVPQKVWITKILKI